MPGPVAALPLDRIEKGRLANAVDPEKPARAVDGPQPIEGRVGGGLLLDGENGTFAVSEDVDAWISDTAAALSGLRAELDGASDAGERRHRTLCELGTAAARFRERVYSRTALDGMADKVVRASIGETLAAIERFLK